MMTLLSLVAALAWTQPMDMEVRHTINVMSGVGSVFRLSPDGRAVGLFSFNGMSRDIEVKLIDVESGAVKYNWKGHADKTDDDGEVAFTGDGSRMIFANGFLVRIIDARTGRELKEWEFEYRDIYSRKAHTMAMSPDGRHAAVPDGEKVNIIDVLAGKIVQEVDYEGKDGEPSRLFFDKDGKRLFVGPYRQSQLQIIDVATGKSRLSASDPCGQFVQRATFSPDGSTFATINANKALCVWDAASVTVRETLATDAPYYQPFLAFNADGSRLIYKRENSVDCWDFELGKPAWSLPKDEHGTMSMSPKGDMLAYGVGKNTVIYDAATGLPRLTTDIHAGYVYFPPSGDLVYLRGSTLDLKTGRTNRWRVGDGSMRLLPDGKGVVVLAYDKIHLMSPSPAKEYGVWAPGGVVKLALEVSNPASPLKAGSSLSLPVTIRNTGTGFARKVRVFARLSDWHPGLQPPKEQFFESISSNSAVTAWLTLSGSERLAGGRVKLQIEATEGNGFDPAPAPLEVECQGFEPPILQLSLKTSGPIKAGDENVLTFTVRNAGNSAAEQVKLSFAGAADGLFLEPKDGVYVGYLPAGQSKDVVYKFYTNTRFSGALPPFKLSVTEATGRYGMAPATMRLAFGEEPALPAFAAPGAEKPAVRLRREAALTASENIDSIAVSPDGKLIAGRAGQQIVVWDVSGGEAKRSFKNSHGKHSGFRPRAFLDDNTILAIAENSVLKLDVAKGKERTLWKGGVKTRYEQKTHIFGPYTIAYNVVNELGLSPDRRVLVVGGCYEKDDGAMMLELGTNREEVLRSGATSCVNQARFSSDGRLLALARSTEGVELWDSASRSKLATLRHGDKAIQSLDFSPDGSLLAVGTADKGLQLWDVAKRELRKELAGQDSDVSNTMFSPDGRWLLAGGWSKAILYDTESWSERMSLNANSFKFLPDGRLAGVSGQGVNVYSLGGGAAPKPKAPAKLTATVSLLDATGVVEAGEKAELEVRVRNDGPGKAFAARVVVVPVETAGGLKLPAPAGLGDIEAGKTATIKLPLSGGLDLQAGKARLKVETREANGFDAAPVVVEFETRKLSAPALELTGLSLAGTGVVKPNEVNKLTVTLRNAGLGAARDVKAELHLGDADIFPAGETKAEVGTLEPGATKKLTFEFFVNARFKGKQLPVALTVTESLRRFGMDRRPLNLTLGEAPSVALVSVKAQARAAAAAPTSDDVDEPPQTRTPVDPEAFAVVVGVERYRQQGLPPVDYASKDARAVHAYLTRAMGYDSRNVVLLQNEGAAKTDLDKYLGSWLKNRVSKNSKVFVYYAGHGAPNPATGDAYLIPFDGDPAYTDDTAYPIRRLYDTLAQLPTKDVTVVLDACFSGQGQRSVIAKGTRPLVSLKKAAPGANTVVLAAAAGEQISASSPEAEHGLLTYHLLRGLRGKADADENGRVTTKELYEFVRPEVERDARRQNVEQTPTLSGESEAVWLRLR